MEPAEIVVVAALAVAYSLVSRRLERSPITMPMLFVGAGAVGASFGAISIEANVAGITLLAELTLSVILFSDAVRIDLRRLRRFLTLPARLLLIGLPLTIVFGALINRLLFPQIALAEVALLAAVLAPTDAALGSAVVEDEAVPPRVRLALNVESGVNDGLVVPVVTILTAVVVSEQRSAIDWTGFVLRQVGGGAVIGVLVGGIGVTSLRAAHRRGWSDGRYEQLATFMLPILALSAGTTAGANSFIAAFVAGLTFGSLGARSTRSEAHEPAPERFDEFTEDAGQLLGLGAFFVFGNVLLGQAVERITVPVVACAVLSLTVVRILPVWLALARTGLAWQTRLFLGWFGPRGLASIIFGLLLLEEFGEDTEAAQDIFSVIGITVAASVVLHGATAAWGARRYGRWADSDERELGADTAPGGDALHDVMPPTRWASKG